VTKSSSIYNEEDINSCATDLWGDTANLTLVSIVCFDVKMSDIQQSINNVVNGDNLMAN